MVGRVGGEEGGVYFVVAEVGLENAGGAEREAAHVAAAGVGRRSGGGDRFA